jgi:hypothetical protein
MCHSSRWQDWELFRDEEPREEEEPRVFGDEPEAEAEEAEPVRTPERERELIRA